MEYMNKTKRNSLMNKMKVKQHVLVVLTLNGVGGHVDNADVIVVYQLSSTTRRAKVKE
jgi:hypothetical protein